MQLLTVADWGSPAEIGKSFRVACIIITYVGTRSGAIVRARVILGNADCHSTRHSPYCISIACIIQYSVDTRSTTIVRGCVILGNADCDLDCELQLLTGCWQKESHQIISDPVASRLSFKHPTVSLPVLPYSVSFLEATCIIHKAYVRDAPLKVLSNHRQCVY